MSEQGLCAPLDPSLINDRLASSTMPPRSAPNPRATDPRAWCLALLQEAEDRARQVIDSTERGKLLRMIRRERAKLWAAP